MNRRCLAVLLLLAAAAPARARDYTRLVVFSDLHLPGRLQAQKRQAVDAVNSWEDVDGVVALGDIVADQGLPEEYAFARESLSQLKKPLFPIAGNHEFMYDVRPDGRKERAGPAERQAKLRLFQDTFGLSALRYSKRFGPYLAIFLSADDLEARYLAALSSSSLAWLAAELDRSPGVPTIIFFHAPLRGTLLGENGKGERPDFYAQPPEEAARILAEHPQVFLWVSGHVHLAADNPRFDHKCNVFAGRITNIHNSDMDGRSSFSDKNGHITVHDSIWTNSLFLYPDRVVVRTYDHKQGVWLEKLTRELRPPK